MARDRGGQTISQNIEVRHAAPIDARTQVKKFSDLTDSSYSDPDGMGIDSSYKYMRAFVEEDEQEYILMGDDHKIVNNWKPYGGGGGNTPSTPGDSYLDAALVASVDVGGVKKNDSFAKGDDFEKVLRAMLAPVLPPTMTEPKATLSRTNGNRLIYGYDETIGTQNFSVAFNQGTISSGGNTVGAATAYKIGDVTNVSNSAALDIDALMASDTTYSVSASVNYAAGDQPKDSAGANYGDPRPAGTLSASPTFKFEKRRYIYATTNNDSVLNRLDIQTKSSSPVEVKLSNPKATPAQVALPAAATKIEFFNTLNNTFEDCSWEFPETRQSIDGISYYVYTDNRGYTAGERQLRFTF